MIDGSALSVLVEHVEDAVTGQGTIADGIINPGEKGLQLLLVNDYTSQISLTVGLRFFNYNVFRVLQTTKVQTSLRIRAV